MRRAELGFEVRLPLEDVDLSYGVMLLVTFWGWNALWADDPWSFFLVWILAGSCINSQ